MAYTTPSTTPLNSSRRRLKMRRSARPFADSSPPGAEIEPPYIEPASRPKVSPTTTSPNVLSTRAMNTATVAPQKNVNRTIERGSGSNRSTQRAMARYTGTGRTANTSPVARATGPVSAPTARSVIRPAAAMLSTMATRRARRTSPAARPAKWSGSRLAALVTEDGSLDLAAGGLGQGLGELHHARVLVGRRLL